MGVKLFERGGRRVLLTPSGRFFQEKAEIIFREYQATLDELKSSRHRPILKLGSIHTILGANLARLVGVFRQQHPNVIVELHNGYLEELQDWLEKGTIDLAITALEENDNPKTSLVLFHQPLFLAVSQDHPFARQSSIHVSDLNGQPYIDRIHCEVWRLHPQWFESMGIKPHVVYFADQEEWVISLIQVGLGMSIMPLWQGVPDLVYLPVCNMDFNRTVGLQWKNNQKTTVVDWFRSVA